MKNIKLCDLINKKIIIPVSLFLFQFNIAFAQNYNLPNRPISEIITGIIEWLLGISLILAILVLVYGGIVYITSVGSDRTEDAKKTITFAILGILLIGVSYSIISVIVKVITGS